MKVLITGDTYLGSERVQRLAERGAVDTLFGPYLEHIRSSDLAITNLESPIIDEGNPISKSGPILSASRKSLPALKAAGFNLLTLANNHIMDFGPEGAFSTFEACERLGMNYVGAGENLFNARTTFFVEKSGLRLGIVNLAENEFGTASGESPGAHPMDAVENYYTIADARKESDKVLVIVHGGYELHALPNTRIKQQYRFYVDAGADAVIGHHPHWCSGYEVYKNAPIFYSLGNFLFESSKTRDERWHLGYGVSLDMKIPGLNFELLPYKQNEGEAGIRNLNPKEQLYFEEYLYSLNLRIADDANLEEEFERLYQRRKRQYRYFIEPHSSQILRKLQRVGLLPSLLSKSKKRLLLNLIKCESHRELLIKHLLCIK